MDISNISVVILSGGKSSRMGQDKALLEIDGKRFVDHLAEKFSQADELLFSVREANDFPEVSLPHITDFYPGCGPLAGIHSALKHAKNAWVFVLACDTPFVDQNTLEIMLNYCRDGVCSIIPREENGRLHPLCGLYHKLVFDKIEKHLSQGNYRVREIFESDGTVFLPVNDCFDDVRVFRNVNTPEDYKEMKE